MLCLQLPDLCTNYRKTISVQTNISVVTNLTFTNILRKNHQNLLYGKNYLDSKLSRTASHLPGADLHFKPGAH